ncbi:MAG: ABC transporter ATP-binding protein [Promethearchaeota archaeon]
MTEKRESLHNTEEIIEESIFSKRQIVDMLDWVNARRGFELNCQITGNWSHTGVFFKGHGKILKKFDGSIFQDRFYLFLTEAVLGKDDMLIGRRVIEIQYKQRLQPLQIIRETKKKFEKNDINLPEIIEPNVFVLRNAFKKDLQNQLFFRNRDFERAINMLSPLIQRYEISAFIEGVLIAKDRQIPCIISGTVNNVSEKEIFISVLNAFNPNDPLNDDTKEWLTQNWTIEIAQEGINKVHPKYLIFEIGEELSLTKRILNVKDLTVVLGGRTIIHDVNFKLEKGEIMGIIGESGAGKSTTLKAILGEFDFQGEISVFGIDARDTKTIAPFIGYVPQDLSRMYGEFNCLENIVAFGRQYGISDDILIQRGKRILADLGIEEVANQPVSSLSGGQKRRASIAIAMVHNPYLIFLDEPTSGLDPLARYELWEFLDVINKNYGITLCVISHYLDEIEYCDKACIFLRGIGFYDFNTPEGLKNNIPGGGLALEITLDLVNLDSIEILKEIKGVIFVIQRGERIRILSQVPPEILAQRILMALEKAKIGIHSIDYKVSVDMIDYFTYISVIHQQEGEDDLGHLSESELKRKSTLGQQNLNEGIGYILEQGKKIKVSIDSSRKILDLENLKDYNEKDVSSISSEAKKHQSEQKKEI